MISFFFFSFFGVLSLRCDNRLYGCVSLTISIVSSARNKETRLRRERRRIYEIFSLYLFVGVARNKSHYKCSIIVPVASLTFRTNLFVQFVPHFRFDHFEWYTRAFFHRYSFTLAVLLVLSLHQAPHRCHFNCNIFDFIVVCCFRFGSKDLRVNSNLVRVECTMSRILLFCRKNHMKMHAIFPGYGFHVSSSIKEQCIRKKKDRCKIFAEKSNKSPRTNSQKRHTAYRLSSVFRKWYFN